MKDPQNCPYCESELMGTSRPWGISPEGWIALKQRHEREHNATPPPLQGSDTNSPDSIRSEEEAN